MTNNYISKISTIDLIKKKGFNLRVMNFEQQLPVYQFYKVKEKKKSALMIMLGFDIEKMLFSTTDKLEMELFIRNYISSEFDFVKEVGHDMYEISN